jgi:hypothetical protein
MKGKTIIITGALLAVLYHNLAETYVSRIKFYEDLKIENAYLQRDAVERGLTMLPTTNCKIDWEISGCTGSSNIFYMDTKA